MELIKTKYDKLKSEPFPSQEGKDIDGVDLVEIGDDTMRIVSRFLESKGRLTIVEKNLLQNCYNDLRTIIPLLDKTEIHYSFP